MDSQTPSDRITLIVDLPPLTTRLPLWGALRQHGVIIAMGSTDAEAGSATATLALPLVEGIITISGEPCDLWLTLDRDGMLSPFPGFGDLYRRETIRPGAAGPTIAIRNPSCWRERALSAPENLITIHYHRFDGQHENATFWSWDATGIRNPLEQELLPVGQDLFGSVFQMDRVDYGAASPERIGFVMRIGYDWSTKDGDDRFWTPTLGQSIYLLASRKRIYKTQPDIQPHLIGVYLDAPNTLVIEVTHPLKQGDLGPGMILVTDSRHTPVPLTSTRVFLEHGRPHGTRIEVVTAAGLGPAGHGFRVAVRDFGTSSPIRPRGVLFDSALFCDHEAILGAQYTAENTRFAVFAPLAHHASVLIYDRATGNEGRSVHALHPAGRGVWEGVVPGDWEGKFYVYNFTGDAHDNDAEVIDPYATNAVHSTTRARIGSLPATDPPPISAESPNVSRPFREGPPLVSPLDMVIYEAHVRDFTISPAAGSRHPGLYLGFAESGLRLAENPEITVGIDHLVELGVTHVQLLPVQDFDNDEHHFQYDWGYMPRVFNSPEGVYATDPDNESRVREFKLLVQALHSRGIGVIMDVVYNHTASFAPFNLTAPGYFYRIHENGSYSNGSGTGNEFHSEAPMARKYIVDTLRHWVVEYGVDGFRFDLMALIDIHTMGEVERELRKVKPSIVLYGEPWQAAPSMCRHPSGKENLRGTGIGAFNDDFRNALKGSPDGDRVGFIQSGFSREALELGIAGSRNSWPGSPAQTINYMTCHDNLVLIDKLKLSKPHASPEALMAMMRLGYLLLLTSQGVPFLHAGEEFGRSKGGHHNSYNAPDSVNQIDWSLKAVNADLLEYVRQLIAIRKSHPLFRLRTYEEIDARLHFLPTPLHEAVLYSIRGSGLPGETWNEACVVVNAHDTSVLEFHIPHGAWNIALPTDLQSGAFSDGLIGVPPKTGVLLFR